MPTFGIAIRAISARQGARVFRAATRDIQLDATGASVRVDRLNRSVNRLGGSFGLIARSAAGFLGSIAAIAGIRSTVKAIADFDEATNRARIIMGLTRDEFEGISDAFREMAVETRFTAVEIAVFGAELAQAGFRGKAALDILKPSLDLAANGAITLTQASTVMIGTLKQWQFQTSESTRVSNVLTKASFLTAASIDEIAEASRKVAPLARRVGLTFEQTTAITAVLTENIRQAARAGTGLRGVMASLLNPSVQIRERFKQAGVSIEDFNIIGGRLVEVLENIDKAAFTTGDKVKLLGRESLIAGLIIEQSGDQLRGLTNELSDLGNFASETARQFEDTLAGSLRRLISAITDAQIELGDSGLLGIMRGIVDFTRDVILALKGQEDGFINLKESILLAKDILLSFLAVITALGSVAAISALGSIVLAFNPITLAIGAAVAALVFFRNETVEVGGVTTTIGNLVVTVWSSVTDAIQASFGVLSSSLKSIFFLARDISTDIRNIVTLNFKAVSTNFSSEFLEALDEVTNASARMTRVFNTLPTNFRMNLEKMNEEVDKFKKDIPEFAGGPTPGAAGSDVNSAVKAIDELTKQQQRAIKFAQEFGDTIGDSFSKMIRGAETAGEALKKLAQDLLDLIIKQTLLQPLANTISLGLTSTFGTALAPTLFNPASAFTGGTRTFAHGGVIGGPTRFRDGLAGEAGPEAILPLKRGPDGDLGVSLAGGSSVVVNMTVQTPNADSFRKSNRQIINEVRRISARLT